MPRKPGNVPPLGCNLSSTPARIRAAPPKDHTRQGSPYWAASQQGCIVRGVGGGQTWGVVGVWHRKIGTSVMVMSTRSKKTLSSASCDRARTLNMRYLLYPVHLTVTLGAWTSSTNSFGLWLPSLFFS